MSFRIYRYNPQFDSTTWFAGSGKDAAGNFAINWEDNASRAVNMSSRAQAEQVRRALRRYVGLGLELGIAGL